MLGGWPARFLPGHRHALLALRDLRDPGVVGDEVADLAREGVADPAHAADRLEHGGLELIGRERGKAAPQPRLQDVAEADHLAGDRLGAEPAAGIARVAAELGDVGPRLVGVILVEHAPPAQRLEQHLAIPVRHLLVELALPNHLGEQLRNMALEVGPDLADPARLATECLGRMQVGIVVELLEGLELHAQPLAVIEQAVVVIGNPPRPRIEIQAGIEFALLRRTAQLGVAVAAAQRPVAPTGAAVELQYLHRVAGLAQLQRRHHAGQSGAEDQHRGALGAALELDPSLVARLGGVPEAGHGLVQRGTSRCQPDQL